MRRQRIYEISAPQSKRLPADHPISGVLRRAKDFRRPEAMADALLHPQDRAYTVPELYAWLDRCGVSFGRWIEQAPYLAQCGAIARSPHAARLASLPSRLQHAAVELFRGTMVAHSFIAHRDDCSDDSQPITFAGDSWRDYIPIALPWTVCVRERLPPGSVAVLINRSHTFTDLILTIDAFEDRLLGAIDGKRSLAEILQFAAEGSDDGRRALNFFERLWQYDQIVFDASATRTIGTVRREHAAVELFRGTMASHGFIAYRDDRSEVSEPINFAGDRWRDYIPIALPWTVCVRERLPPGSVAVLINRSHKFADLICTIELFRGPAARRHRRESNPGRNSAICGAGRRRQSPSPEVLRAPLAIRPNRL